MEVFEEFINLFSELNIVPSHILVTGIVVAVFIVELILVKKGILRFDAGVKRRDKAIATGHIMKARRISYYDDERLNREKPGWYHADYEYTLDGRKRTYRYLSRHFPAVEITLYYINNPRRPFHYEKKTSVFAILLYVIPVAVGVLVVKVFGLNI